MADNALQVARFRDIQQDWVVFPLPSDLEQAKRPVGIEAGAAEHFQEIRPR